MGRAMTTPHRQYFRDNPPDIPTDTPSAFGARVQRYLRAFQNALRRRPTDLQRDLMQAAAYAQSRYDEALRNPHITPNDLEALERIARRAGNAMHASFKIRPEQPPALMLADVLGYGARNDT
jgi:hypothetical protein